MLTDVSKQVISDDGFRSGCRNVGQHQQQSFSGLHYKPGRSLKPQQSFCQLSGLRVNYEKTKAMWIGTNRHNHKIEVKDKDIEWPDQIKALGVWFTLDAERSRLLNYKERSEKVSKLINDWSHRRLTLIGKMKSLLASQLIYILSPLPTNIKYVESIQKELFAFLWDGKND